MSSPAIPAQQPVSAVREKMAAAAGRIARLKRIDRLAVGIITLGGIAIIVAVLGILVFIGAEAVPLFRSAAVTPAGRHAVATGLSASTPAFRAVGMDEYRKYLYILEPDGHVAFYGFDTGQVSQRIPVPGLAGATVTATSRSVSGSYLAAGTTDGRVLLAQVRFTPQFVDQRLADLSLGVRERGAITVDPGGRPVRQVSYDEQDGQQFVAALVGDREIAYWSTDADGSARPVRVLGVPEPDVITQVRVGRYGTLIAGTDGGRVYHWTQPPDLVLSDVSPVSDGAITALEWLLGGATFLAGTARGDVSAWFRAPLGEDGSQAMLRVHELEPHGAPVTGFAVSSRERSFVSLAADGSLVLRHPTSERVLTRLDLGGVPQAVVITPKADGLIVLRDGELQRFDLWNPHPEVSFKALFGKVWYEGYSQPEYVWQSTAATDDFEPKLSLVPLVFGTIKGTVYALLFAIPLAVLGALYTSQFVHPSIRAKVKPAVEIMAALPSVVIGFLAGLYLAAVVERHLVAVLLMFLLLPSLGTAGLLVWRRLPTSWLGRAREGAELVVILPLLVLGLVLAVWWGPTVEGAAFGGDARSWIQNTLGLTYDQRNSLVVGLAMGFAVVPIIFTISEDAFSSVPSSLTAASLALGASRWQTATRVVLPTASPGVFSAIMVGFGRAVGETMIVLMATGNTPVMEWSIFNGIRTLSANIAVEIPEAPEGGTLYRVLFLSAALLFVLTFVVNTIAEVVRQRLRDRYKAI
jgi:phosphate transport system permease protein